VSIVEATKNLAGAAELDPNLYRKEAAPYHPSYMLQPVVRYKGGVKLPSREGQVHGEDAASPHRDPRGVLFPSRHAASLWSKQQRLCGGAMWQHTALLQVRHPVSGRAGLLPCSSTVNAYCFCLDVATICTV
jgi:hypothetical protein